MKNISSGDKYQLVTEINMIPFIDVSLVLLIIVMVMTPFLVKEQLKIDLPKTKSVSTPVDSNKLMQIEVTREGKIYVDGVNVPDDGVYEAVRTRLTDPENQPVVIAADRDVAFEKVVVAMDAAKRCGAKHLGVSVSHEGGSSGGGEGGARAEPAAEKTAPRPAAHAAPSADKPKGSATAPKGTAAPKGGGSASSKSGASSKKGGSASSKRAP